MSDEMKSILNYIRVQTVTFKRLEISVPSDYNKGIIAGMDIVKNWIEITNKEAK